MSSPTPLPAPTVALVLPGGGARGAYEAGALSVLLPALEARGERVSVVCGTSVGAINAAMLGSVADLPARVQADRLVARWRSMRKGDVISPIIGPNLPLTALRFVGDLLELPGFRLASVMDAGPLRRSLRAWIDWPKLHANVAEGFIDAVCVVATSLARGGPTAFVESRGPLPVTGPGDALAYVDTVLEPQHVRASAAIPFLFPPVEVRSPPSAAGAYVDGATRLNSPIAPALALGARRVVVIGFDPFTERAPPPAAADHDLRPRLADVAANVLDGLLVDQVADDLHRLVSINAFYVEGSGGSSQSARSYRAARGKAPYKRISYALVAPERRGQLADLAEDVFAERYAGWRGLTSPDYPIISRLLGGGRTRARGELLSFLLFDEHYVAALLDAGAADAQRWLDRHPRLWCSDAAHDFPVDPAHLASAHEQQRLDEFRSLRPRHR